MANIPGVPFKLTAEDVGAFDAAKSFKSGQDIISKLIEQQLNEAELQRRKSVLPFAGRMAMAEAISKELANQFQAPRSERAPQFAQAELEYAQGRPEHQAAETSYLGQQSKYYAPNIMSQIAERQAQTEAQLLKNPFIPQSEKARIAEEIARAKYYEMGGAKGQGGVPQQELNSFVNQIKKDYPELSDQQAAEVASAHLEGQNVLPNGAPVPQLSGLANTLLTAINNRKGTPQVRNQATQMEVLASELNDIDITPVAKFSGIKGRADVAKYTALMAAGKEVPEEFREYLNFKDIMSNFNMDSFRKSFGTSVVPGYVYSTLGKASNPASTWWHDPKQVVYDWNKTKKWVNENASKLRNQALGRHGANNSPNMVPRQDNTAPDIQGKNNNDPLGLL